MLSGESMGYDTWPHHQLRQFVTNNAPALQLIRKGLQKESAVRIEYTPQFLASHVTDLANFKRLALLFKAEGWLAEMENRPNDAARIYLDGINFCNQWSHGGLFIDTASGIALENSCLEPLKNLAPLPDLKTSHEAISILEHIDSTGESPHDVIDRDRQWSRRTFGSRYFLWTLFARKQNQKMWQSLEIQIYKCELNRRRLILALAAHAYELDHHQKPDNSHQLVPQYLKTVPLDPETGAPLGLDSSRLFK